MKPYYEENGIVIYHADCREVLPSLPKVDLVLTDPPYPNNGGHFVDQVRDAAAVVSGLACESLVFWSEVEHPPSTVPLVALHICTYNNVNGKLYEAIYHHHPDGIKRRGCVFHYWMIKEGIGPADREYLGHPTQKGSRLMAWAISRSASTGTILDPFMGSGTTLRAAKDLGR